MQNHLLSYVCKGLIMLCFLPCLISAEGVKPFDITPNHHFKVESERIYKNTVAPCIPVSNTASQYINEIKFLGTLTADITHTTGFVGTGYANYTTLQKKARQIPGGVINVNVSTSNAQGVILSTTKAWVDWNKDEIFDQTAVEKVYDISQIGALSGNVIFGFVIPAGTSPGFYTIRIRASGTDSGFDACSTIQSGEAEDYTFEVVEECETLITAVDAEKRCGPGSVVLTATASSAAVSYQWYASEFGQPILGQTSSTFATPVLPVGKHTYYVSTFNGSCQSTFRTPIEVVVSPTPVIQFSQSSPEICGPISSTVITSSADKEEVVLLEENFDNTAENPVKFENIYAGNTNVDGRWQLRASPYVPQTPPYNVVKPAISSGYKGGNFANIITDVRQNTNIINHFTLKNALNSTDFTDLRLEFDLYFFSEEDIESKNYFLVQYSLDGGSTWVNLKKYIEDIGIPSRFQNEIIPLPAVCENQPQLLIRFTAFALGSNNEWMADIVALDNIKIYGNREVPANFIWSGNTTLFDSTCSAPPPVGGSPSICIKPSEADNQAKPEFSITAAATLANGCSVSRTINIANNNKVWDVETGDNWAAANWQPTSGVPDLSKCVLVKKPVSIYNGGHFEAKNVKVASTGELNINANASLKIQDALMNEASENDVVIESGGHLLQVNDNINLNSGRITAKKSLKISTERKQFNYIISPVEGQNLKTIYPGITSVIAYNEATSFFTASDGNYIKGRALAVEEPTIVGIPVTETEVTSKFVGNVTNGEFSVPIVNSAPANDSRGYNLVGNPYPSSIDLTKLYEINGSEAGNLSATFYFWDSSVNGIYVQQGSNYGGQSYGQFNALNGTGTPATGDLSTATNNIPSKYVTPAIGFMTRALLPTVNLKFQNYIRTNQPIASGVAFKNTASEIKDRFWISLISPANIASTMAVVYFPGGNSGLAQDDSQSLLGADAIYSLVEEEKISINGKSTFHKNDKVELGTSHFANGNYQIKVVQKEGIFAADQKIYLKDKQTGIIADISEASYTFQTSPGIYTGRFELVYEPAVTLSTNTSVKEDLVIYRRGTEWFIKSATKNITHVEIYDAAGRLVHQQMGGQKEIRFDGSNLNNGVYHLKIDQNGTVATRKIIK